MAAACEFAPVWCQMGIGSRSSEHVSSSYQSKCATGMYGLAQNPVVVRDDLLRRQASLTVDHRRVSVFHQDDVETKAARRTGGGVDAVVGRRASDYHRVNVIRSQDLSEVVTEEAVRSALAYPQVLIAQMQMWAQLPAWIVGIERSPGRPRLLEGDDRNASGPGSLGEHRNPIRKFLPAPQVSGERRLHVDDQQGRNHPADATDPHDFRTALPRVP